jgi:molybdopterin converting factor small subunit
MSLQSKPSRRQVLKTIVLLSLSAGAAFLGGSILTTSLLKRSAPSRGLSKESPSLQSEDILNNTKALVVSPNPSVNASSTPSVPKLDTIKVRYFGMSVQSTGTSNEYFVMSAPVLLQEVINEIEKRHPVISAMLPTMQILVNGNPADSSTNITDGSEIDLIPIFAGG